MVAFTKAERHKLYKYALKRLKSDSKTFRVLWICCYLGEKVESGLVVRKNFPEFFKRKPRKVHGLGWFPGNDYDKRFKILTACIEETA